MNDELEGEGCQWKDYGHYDCEKPVDEVLTVLGEEIALCEIHARQLDNTQL